MGRQTYRRRGRQTERQTNEESNRQTSRHTVVHVGDRTRKPSTYWSISSHRFICSALPWRFRCAGNCHLEGIVMTERLPMSTWPLPSSHRTHVTLRLHSRWSRCRVHCVTCASSLCIWLSQYLSLSLCLSVGLSVCLYVRLSISLFLSLWMSCLPIFSL